MTDSIPTTQEVPTLPSSPQQPFCTNCGKTVSEQAIACMACGAGPIGHKKFCRQCGVGLNPEQIVCIKCGSAVNAAKGLQSLSFGNMSAVTVSEITIFIAAALALISFVLPWVEFTIPMAAKVTRNGFSTYAFWFGLVFVYPAWMALTKQYIKRAAGFLCAGIGIVAGIAYPHFVIARGLGSIEKGLSLPGGSEITRELTAVGSGAYVFIGACILLIVGIVLRHRAAPQPEQDINQSKPWMAFASLALGCVAIGSVLLFIWMIVNIPIPDEYIRHNTALSPFQRYSQWLIPLGGLVCMTCVVIGHWRLKARSKPIPSALYFSGMIYLVLLSFILYGQYRNVRFNTLLWSFGPSAVSDEIDWTDGIKERENRISMLDFFRSKQVLTADASGRHDNFRDRSRFEQRDSYGYINKIVRDKNENRYIFIYENWENSKSAILYRAGLFPALFVLWHVIFILGVFWGHKGLKTKRKTARAGIYLLRWGFLIYMLFPVLFCLIGLNITQFPWWMLFRS